MNCSPKIIKIVLIVIFKFYLFILKRFNTFSVVAASTCTPAEFNKSLTTFSFPEYDAKCKGVIPDSVPSSPTKEVPVGASDFTVPGT